MAIRKEVCMKAYVVKARSKLGNLPTVLDYQNLIDEDSPDRRLEKIESIYPDTGDIENKEEMKKYLNEQLSSSIKSLSYFLKDPEKEFFDRYVSSFEVRIVQNVIQAILNNSLDESYDLFVNNPFAKNIVIRKDMNFEEFIHAMKNSRYHRSLVPFLNGNMSKDSVIFLISNTLTKFYYRDLLDYASKFPKKVESDIKNYVGKEIDIFNIEMLYRLKSFFNLKDYETFNYLIEGGKSLRAKDLKELSALSLSEFIDKISESKYKDIFISGDDINKSIMDERFKLMTSLSNKDGILYLIYAVNMINISNKNLISLLEADETFPKIEIESYVLMRWLCNGCRKNEPSKYNW